jgi:hypothetical protein
MPLSTTYWRWFFMAKDVAIRAMKTFWQSGIAYLVATFSTQMGTVDVFDLHDVQSVFGGLLVGALAAGLSASWNGVIQPILERYKGGE